MRRQNHSCDQCRKAKRACDAPRLSIAHRGPKNPHQSLRDTGSSSSPHGQEQKPRSCSYCLKTKKHCTLNWARSQLRLSTGDSPIRGHAPSGRHHQKGRRTISQSDSLDYPAAGLFNPTQTSLPHRTLYNYDSIPSLEVTASRRGSSQDSIPLTEGVFDNTRSQVTLQDFLDDCRGYSGDSSRDPGSILTAINDVDIQQNDYEYPYFYEPVTFREDGDFNVSSRQVQDVMSAAPQTGGGRPQAAASWLQQVYNTLSPFSAEHAMISRTDNNFISQNLLRVYHDVLEHSLSCWVSEETCPYKMPPRKRARLLGMGMADTSQHVNSGRGNQQQPAQQEWGAIWSNRIYTRVVQLDRAAQSCGMIRLSRAENQAVAKALHLVIMAFSSQWAHQSRRERERFPSVSVPPDITQSIPPYPDELGEEFDRTIQRSFWEQARKALSDCADVECYRVVCAELIFGLTQRPWESDDDDDPILDTHSTTVFTGPDTRGASAMAQIQSILSKDGPPLFIERATRKVHVLRFRFDALDAGVIKGNKAGSNHNHPYEVDPTSSIISARDRETAGFVYWLAVMFDTISSSINQRPVVVNDEDSQHDAVGEFVVLAGGPSPGASSSSSSSSALRVQRWSINHFIQDNPADPVQPPLRWPCSYEDAARAVTRSGPVKILLYRHVSYLQDAIRRGQRGEAIEDIIRGAVVVYCYWNATYGVLFRDLIEGYDAVPPRIQSWFFCILAHWHLAALILADLVELVDEQGLGVPQANRGATTVDAIRRASAVELADLARITTPPDAAASSSSPQQLPEFHSAVSQGAILTEPWTVILIRAFSKAFIWHLGRVELWRRSGALLGHHHHHHHGHRQSCCCRESRAQCVDYVKALWYLGRKSDMARNIAGALSRALAAMEEEDGGVCA
ncbi:hypothetical protein F5X96DRAFT_691194 [Biscogniauxia mediterranea]|nr:hypothetical protein F5X96DRAFT_691194 [Biscogniauxia mediterranea]